MTEPDTVRGVHRAAGLERRYRLVTPPGPGPADGLVVMLHGCTQDAGDFAAGTGMDAAAAREGWAVLYPEQDPADHPQTCWRWYEAAQRERGSGEAALLADLAATVAGGRVEPEGPVLLAGISAGAAMALNVFALRPDLFDAVGLHSGVPYGAADDQAEGLAAMAGRGPEADELARRLRAALARDAPPAAAEAPAAEKAAPAAGRLPPLIVFHGTADEAVAPANARRIVAAWHGAAGLRDAGDEGRGAEAGGSEPDPPALPEPDDRERGEDGRPWERLCWPAAEGRGPVELWRVEGLGHAWSGGRPEGSFADPEGPSATRALVRFFRRAAGGEDGGGEGER